jgi:hypothetical protein
VGYRYLVWSLRVGPLSLCAGRFGRGRAGLFSLCWDRGSLQQYFVFVHIYSFSFALVPILAVVYERPISQCTPGIFALLALAGCWASFYTAHGSLVASLAGL